MPVPAIAMPSITAKRLCPQLIFVDGHFKEYQRLGDAAIRVLGDFTPAAIGFPAQCPAATVPGGYEYDA